MLPAKQAFIFLSYLLINTEFQTLVAFRLNGAHIIFDVKRITNDKITHINHVTIFIV